MKNRSQLSWGALVVAAMPLWAACSGNGGGGGVTTLGCEGPGLTTDAQGRVLRYGTVNLESESERLAGGGQSISFASAVFQAVSTAKPCVWASTLMGPCQVVHCLDSQDGGSPPAQDGGASTLLSAGLIQIGGGAKQVTLTPTADGRYGAYGDNSALWSGGETLSISAAGAAVPAFSTSLTAPGQPTVTAPVLPGGAMSLAVKRTQDLQVAWTGGAGAGIEVDLNSYNQATGAAITARCVFGGTSGAVPAAVLGLFPAGEAVAISAAAFTCKNISAGAWTVQPYAYSEALNGTGTPFHGTLSIP